MRVFVAGGTGVVGRPLVRRLQEAGHDVTALARSPQRAAEFRDQGVLPFVADPFDPEAVAATVAAARPDVVVHQLTALPQRLDVRKYAQQTALTNRLREETVPHFARAAVAAGAKRLVVQSQTFVTEGRSHLPRVPESGVLDESAPFALEHVGALAQVNRAIARMESVVTNTTGIEGVVLRYGSFYGPGTYVAPDGMYAELLRARQLPIIGRGSGITSFVHVDDAAAATVLAIERGEAGVFNITDDEPVPARVYLPEIARRVGAPRPRRVPTWLARLVAGPVAVYFGVDALGASNAKAREALGWTPDRPTWRDGFDEVFSDPGG